MWSFLVAFLTDCIHSLLRTEYPTHIAVQGWTLWRNCFSEKVRTNLFCNLTRYGLGRGDTLYVDRESKVIIGRETLQVALGDKLVVCSCDNERFIKMIVFTQVRKGWEMRVIKLPLFSESVPPYAFAKPLRLVAKPRGHLKQGGREEEFNFS